MTPAAASGDIPERWRTRESCFDIVPRQSRLHLLEPTSALRGWFLVGLHDPVFTRRCDSALVDLEERERVVRADCGVGDTHLRHHGAPLRNDPEHFDRPAFRIAAVEIHEIRAASDPDLVVRPFEDEVIREQLPYADPVPGLNSAPELGDNFARLHAPIIRRQGTVRLGGSVCLGPRCAVRVGRGPQI